MNSDVGKQIKRLALFCGIVGDIVAGVVAFWFMDLWTNTERNWYIFLAIFSLIVIAFLSYLVFLLVFSWGSVVDNVERIKTKVYGETNGLDDFPILKKVATKKEKAEAVKKEEIIKKENLKAKVLSSLKKFYDARIISVSDYDRLLTMCDDKDKFNDVSVFVSDILKTKKEYDEKKISDKAFEIKCKYTVSKFLG